MIAFLFYVFLFLTTFKFRKGEEICCFGANCALSLELCAFALFLHRLHVFGPNLLKHTLSLNSQIH